MRRHICAPFPSFVIWKRRGSGAWFDTAKGFALGMSDETGVGIRAAAERREAASADMICTVTGSPTPALQAA